MAQITINEISQNYTYNTGNSSFATVALPITAMWGPGYIEEPGAEVNRDTILEETMWEHFPATQVGLESFVSTYRGPVSNYRLYEDYSYQMAMTLLTSGYDILVCRVTNGGKSSAYFHLYNKSTSTDAFATLHIKAKYPGSFGNNLICKLSKVRYFSKSYWNLIVYVKDSSGSITSVENLAFVLNKNNSTDNILYYEEIESKYITMILGDPTDKPPGTPITDKPSDVDNAENIKGGSVDKNTYATVSLSGGYDMERPGREITSGQTKLDSAISYAKNRYMDALNLSETDVAKNQYIMALSGLSSLSGFVDNLNDVSIIFNNEWKYTAAYYVYDLLKDKLNYSPQRIISPGWDDQNICALNDAEPSSLSKPSPLHVKIMETAYYSRCGCGLIDVPHSVARSNVYNESDKTGEIGYAQILSRYQPANFVGDTMLYSTHSALFAPWGTYQYVGTSKQHIASPSFLALMIQRAMILNQSMQYEWALPTNRKHTLKIGKFEYKVPKKVLDVWQKLEGVGVNVITTIPELGTSLWGNSTLYEVPPATYQALANLSTRYLVNAVEDVAYRCGLAITFQYNNEQAYNKFYAGVTPTLDTMKNVGAIDDYYVKMAADINGLDQVNANTVIGKIYLVINGVINDIVIDLIALPPGTDLNQYRS